MKRVKQSDIWRAARWVMGPEDSWGPEYSSVILDVASALEAFFKTGSWRECDIKTLERWENIVDCRTLVSGTKEEGELLLENLCY